MGTDGVEAMVTSEGGVVLGRVELFQGDDRATDHGNGDDAVERDHRSWRECGQQLVEPEDLSPVGVLGMGRLVVHGGDRGL